MLYCAADEGARLAVACDDGVTRFFVAEESVPGLTYQRSVGRVDSRVLALVWHPSGATLFSGHSDAVIRAWDAATGREIYRIDTGELNIHASLRLCGSRWIKRHPAIACVPPVFVHWETIPLQEQLRGV